MDFQEVVKARRSVRAYKPDAVPASAIAKIAEAVSLAPTACNLQPFKVLFALSPATKGRICDVYTAGWLKTAPAIALVLTNSDAAWKRVEGDTIADVDGAIAMENLVLAATAEGLGTCWICAFDRKRMDASLGIKAPWRSFAITPVGYAAVEASPSKRKKIEETFLEIK